MTDTTQSSPGKSRLHLRFINGMNQLGYTEEDIEKFKYCGGDRGSHANYFKIAYPGKAPPAYNKFCVCGQSIKENCYIIKDDKIVIVGNCCIKKFLPEGRTGRTCEICETPHHNRKDNKCNDCRTKPVKKYYIFHDRCIDCNRQTKGYRRCYNCHILNSAPNIKT